MQIILVFCYLGRSRPYLLSLTFTRELAYLTHNCKMVYWEVSALYSPRWYKTQHSCDVVVSNPANKNARISSCTSWSVSLYFDSGSRALNNKVNKSFLLLPSSLHWRCLMICLTRLSRTLWCWWTWNALKGCLQDQSFGNTKKAISPACLRNEFTAYKLW